MKSVLSVCVECRKAVHKYQPIINDGHEFSSFLFLSMTFHQSAHMCTDKKVRKRRHF